MTSVYQVHRLASTHACWFSPSSHRCATATACDLDQSLQLGPDMTMPRTNVRGIAIDTSTNSRSAVLNLDLDVHAGGQLDALQRVDRLRIGIHDVDQPLVDPHLEVFT